MLQIKNNISMNKTKVDQNPWRSIHSAKRRMAVVMEKSRDEVVPATIFEDLILCGDYTENRFDITVHLIKAIVFACQKEPEMNSWFKVDRINSNYQTKLFQQIDLGIAVDYKNELFLPVIRSVNTKSDQELRQELDLLKHKTYNKDLLLEDISSATFVLSNFGKFAGKYAVPVVITPMVGILAVGKLYEDVIVLNNVLSIRKFLPLSLSFDHRAITGGQAARFLQAIKESFLDNVVV